MPPRRRILLDVQPRLLHDALLAVLDSIGVDEVLVSDREPADRSPVSYDAAILTRGDTSVRADVVIEVGDLGAGHVTIPTRDESVQVRTLPQLLAALDRFCPAPTARVAL